jgi:hypothetical protein
MMTTFLKQKKQSKLFKMDVANSTNNLKQLKTENPMKIVKIKPTSSSIKMHSDKFKFRKE